MIETTLILIYAFMYIPVLLVMGLWGWLALKFQRTRPRTAKLLAAAIVAHLLSIGFSHAIQSVVPQAIANINSSRGFDLLADPQFWFDLACGSWTSSALYSVHTLLVCAAVLLPPERTVKVASVS